MYLLLFVVLGMIFGSFLNVVIYRLPIMMQSNWNKEVLEYLEEQAPSAFSDKNLQRELKNNLQISNINLALPASHCTSCDKKIAWWQNIPVLSYVILAGKSSCCDSKISWIYPAVEILSGALVGVLAYKFFYVDVWTFAMLAIFTLCVLSISFIDLKHFLIPDSIVLPLLWLGLIWHFVEHRSEFEQFFYGAIFGYLILWILNQVFTILLKKPAMGNGDFKLLAAIAAWFGWQVMLPIIFIASLLGILAFLCVGLIEKIKSNKLNQEQALKQEPMQRTKEKNKQKAKEAQIGKAKKEKREEEEEEKEEQTQANISFNYKAQIPFAPFLSIASLILIFATNIINKQFELWFFYTDWFNFLF